MHGTVCNSHIFAALKRLSPAISSKLSPILLTERGCKIPLFAIDSANYTISDCLNAFPGFFDCL